MFTRFSKSVLARNTTLHKKQSISAFLIDGKTRPPRLDVLRFSAQLRSIGLIPNDSPQRVLNQAAIVVFRRTTVPVLVCFKTRNETKLAAANCFSSRRIERWSCRIIQLTTQLVTPTLTVYSLFIFTFWCIPNLLIIYR